MIKASNRVHSLSADNLNNEREIRLNISIHWQLETPSQHVSMFNDTWFESNRMLLDQISVTLINYTTKKLTSLCKEVNNVFIDFRYCFDLFARCEKNFDHL